MTTTVTQETIESMYEMQEPLPKRMIDYGFGEVEEIGIEVKPEVQRQIDKLDKFYFGDAPVGMAFGEFLY